MSTQAPSCKSEAFSSLNHPKIRVFYCSKHIIKLQWKITENSENQIDIAFWKQEYSISLLPQKEREMPSKEAENKTSVDKGLR